MDVFGANVTFDDATSIEILDTEATANGFHLTKTMLVTESPPSEVWN